MNIAQGPVNGPVLTFMIFLVIITLGIVSFSRLTIDLMPEVTYPVISVVASYGNVGPQEMEELVTRPIEEALAAVQGVEEITSTSSEGASRVRVAFTWVRIWMWRPMTFGTVLTGCWAVCRRIWNGP